jgi:predicted small integral membrane protein
VVLAMTGALVCLAFFFESSVKASRNPNLIPATPQHLSTAEVQNLIATPPKGHEIYITLYQCRSGLRFLSGAVREKGTPVSALPAYSFDAPAENSTLALLAEKGISYRTTIESRGFTPSIRAVGWLLGHWAILTLMPVFCFFILVAGAATLLRRRGHPPSEPRLIAAARNERRVDKAFAALAACAMAALAVWLGLATDWKVRRVAADQVPGIIAQHKNARFEVFEYRDGSSKLWISDLRSPDFIAPADESTLGLLSRQGITYQTRLADIEWWHRNPSVLEPSSARSTSSSAQPKPPSSGRAGLSQSTSALGILVLAAAAGTVLWWVTKSRPPSTSRIQAVTLD